jgi:DNA mismatch repair protein MutS
MMAALEPISLLWPENAPRSESSGYKMADLHLDSIIRALSVEGRYERHIRAILLAPNADARVIAYRQEIIEDLLHSPHLVTRLQEALAIIVTLERYMNEPQWQESELRRVAWRLSELENYIDCVIHLNAMLGEAGGDLRSEGLCRLREMVNAIVKEESFRALQAELPDLLTQIRSVKSVTIGVNLDEQLRPMEATLLSINTNRFKGISLSFLNLFMNKKARKAENEGIASLHSAGQADGFIARLQESDTPLMNPLFKDLADVLDQTSRPIALTLKRYVHISGRLLVALEKEIAFYLGAARLINRMRAAGLPMCRAEIVPIDERICTMHDLYNLNLALHLSANRSNLSAEMVTNEVNFGDAGRIFILTGPNRGGKTTYTQAVGLAQILMQAGMYVPATQARMSPVDGIFTHFAAEEKPDEEAGRLGEESKRLSEIFAQATRHSLILMNESLASTSAGESLYLARDIVRVMRMLGARVIFATHLHELAADADAINAETPGDSQVISLVSMVSVEGNGVRRTYKIVPSPPMGMSYAREIASRYGISFDQLTAALRARKAIP